MTLPIITTPNPLLRTSSKRVQKLDKKLIQFISNLGETLVKKDNPPGVGLSAIQVGKPIRVFATNLPPGFYKPEPPTDSQKLTLEFFINPTITKASPTKTLGPDPKRPLLEGCLSIPNIYGPVYRHDWIDLEYETIDIPLIGNPSSVIPKKRKARFEGFTARVIQHEQDHLNGVLFTDYSLKSNLPVFEDHEGRLTEISLY